MAEQVPDPRAAFATALTRLRGQVPTISDEALARRATTTLLPSGRRVSVNARRLGEWISGQSVPRDFDVVVAVVRAVDAACGRTGPPIPLPQWQRLWRAAVEYRAPARRAAGDEGTGRSGLIVGHPPSDAASVRERTPLANAIDDALADGNVRRVLLTGPGGVGKSQLAAAAFHRSRAAVLVWVPASSRQSVVSTYARAWRAMSPDGGRPHRDGPHADHGWDDQTQADLFVGWLRTASGPWLVVLDDVDDPADLAGLWPAGEPGRSIVTTRRRDAALIRPPVKVIQVGTFTADEATGYLRDRLSLDPAIPGGGPEEAATDADLGGLAAALGYFPLALSQAAAFLIDTGMSVAGYRDLLGDQRETLLDLFPPSSPGDEHDGTVASTFQLALDRAAQLAQPDAARSMLQLVAMLSPDGIPQGVLSTPAARGWIGTDTDRATLMALRALHRLNLVTHDQARSPASVEVHALVQRAARETVPEDRRARLVWAAATALDEAWSAPGCDGETAAALYRNAEVLRAGAGDRMVDVSGLHPVLRRLAEHLSSIGRATATREVCAELLATAQSRLGEEHRDVLYLRAQLACAIGELGDATAAHDSLAEARRAAERALGPSDPDTLWIRVHEVRFQMESGAAEAALPEFTDLAGAVATVFGPDHPTVLVVRRYVALCRGLTGDAAGAREAYTALARELREHHGARHPAALNALSDLGRWIGETGDPGGAVDAYREAVEGLESVVGRLHHDTLVARHNLAYWRGIAGDLDLAVAEFVVAAGDAERALGAEHPTTLTYRVNLAFWRGLAGAPRAAMAELAGLQQAVDRVLGVDHPRALRTRQQRIQLQHAAGDRTGAVAQLRALLTEMTRVQGHDHARTREVADLLAHWAGTVET